MNHSFRKTNRLLKATEFTSVMESGMKAVQPALVVFARKSSGSPPKLGLVVSKKVGGAVERNKVKRRLRECFRESKHLFDGLEIVVIARTVANKLESKVLCQQMVHGVRRLKAKLN